MKKISYGRQFIDRRDIKAVTRVLESDWLTQGPKVKGFEDALLPRFIGIHDEHYAPVGSTDCVLVHIFRFPKSS